MSLVPVPAQRFVSRYHGAQQSVAAFSIGDFPVTVGEFAAFVAATGHVTTAEREGWGYVFEDGGGRWQRQPGANWRNAGAAGRQHDDHPVVLVSRDDAWSYCRWAGGRLPSPAEWELAAGGGTRRFPWGDAEEPLGDCLAGSPVFATRARREAPARCASPFGCLDMLGHVWEWTAAASRAHAGCGVFMGGGWSDPRAALHCALGHDDDPPAFRVDDVGFRLVRDGHAA